MAYATGTANDLAGLLSAIQTALTANGWTLSGEVLHKGTAYFRLWAVAPDLWLQGGTGIDGSNNLTGAAPGSVRFGAIGATAISYPLTYEVFINTPPDEVCVVINYDGTRYQMMYFGLSNIAGLTGTGVFFGATRSGGSGALNFRASLANFTVGGSGSTWSAWPIFYADDTANTAACPHNSYIHHDTDARGWSTNSTNELNVAWSFPALDSLIGQLPNAWNSETVLLPFTIFVPRSSDNKVSVVADFEYLRHIRIDNHNPGDTITLDTDNWKLYPWYVKDSANRDGGSNITHSGTFGFAVRMT